MRELGSFKEFSTLNRTGFILGYENWDMYDFKALLLIWDTRKNKLCGNQDGAIPGCSYSCSLTVDVTSSACICGCVVNGVSAIYSSSRSIIILYMLQSATTVF